MDLHNANQNPRIVCVIALYFIVNFKKYMPLNTPFNSDWKHYFRQLPPYRISIAALSFP